MLRFGRSWYRWFVVRLSRFSASKVLAFESRYPFIFFFSRLHFIFRFSLLGIRERERSADDYCARHSPVSRCQSALTTKARKTFRGFLQLYITSHYKPRPEAGGSRWIFAFAFASKGIVGGRCEYAIIILRNQHPVANKCTMTDRECR